jgi:hypothetical protein
VQVLGVVGGIVFSYVGVPMSVLVVVVVKLWCLWLFLVTLRLRGFPKIA